MAVENRRVFGMCNSAHGHGHNYVVEVTLRGTPSPETGMLMDLNVLSRVVREKQPLAPADAPAFVTKPAGLPGGLSLTG